MAKDPLDPAAEPEEEVDVARLAIYFLGILLVGLAGVLWALYHKRDQYREAVAFGERNLPKMSVTYDKVSGLLKEFRESGANEARSATQGWLKARYSAANIQEGQVATDPWGNRPAREYIENHVNVTVKGITRQQGVQFLWNVEKMSTKMRTIELKFLRTAPKDQPEADLWELRASFGYRVPRSQK